jgi:hypothetical protein
MIISLITKTLTHNKSSKQTYPHIYIHDANINVFRQEKVTKLNWKEVYKVYTEEHCASNGLTAVKYNRFCSIR